MKKNRKRKKKTFLLIWFFLVALLLTTGTYAWFSSNRIVYIEFFNVHVETDGGMQISADASNWKTLVEIEELATIHETTYPDSVNQLPSSMNPVSTAGSIDRNTGYLKMYYGAMENDGLDSYVLSTFRDTETRGFGLESSGNFIAFDIFFRGSGQKQLYLDSTSYVKYAGEKGVGIENSARVAFVVMGNTPSTDSVANMQAMKNSSENSVYIWEPNYDTHTESGVLNAETLYGIKTTETDAKKISYSGVNAEINKTMNVTMDKANAKSNPDLFKEVDIAVATKSEFTTNMPLFTLQDGVTKVRVYMWLEGQDVDSENNASFGNIDYYIQFTLNA